MAPRKRSNLLALAILSLLTERPMHPYEMAAVMRERDISSTVKLNFGALYSNIETLHRLGLIVPVETRREGRHPERTIYTATEAGRAELFDWLRTLIRTPAKEYSQFGAGLAFIAHLSPAELLTLLRERLDALARLSQEQEAVLAAGRRQHLARLFQIEDEFRLAQIDAEREWVGRLVREISDGTLAEEVNGILRWRVTDPVSATSTTDTDGQPGT